MCQAQAGFARNTIDPYSAITSLPKKNLHEQQFALLSPYDDDLGDIDACCSFHFIDCYPPSFHNILQTGNQNRGQNGSMDCL